MKIELKVYLTQPRKGQYEASMPWVPEFAQPLRGPSPAALKEELLFRVLEYVEGAGSATELDRLLPPDNLQIVSVYLEIERKLDPERPPISLQAITHVLLGQWPGDDHYHMWVPRAPGVCLALEEAEAIYVTLTGWVEDWAEQLGLEDLETLNIESWGRIDEMPVDLGYPDAIPKRSKPNGPSRMRRPETLGIVATNLTHRADDGSLEPAFGREALVEQLVEVLMSPKPAHVCLVGPPGVGKTALLHEAVRRVFSLQRSYQQRRDFWETSGDRIIAGMSVLGQWEQRVSQMCEELTARSDILVLDDLLGWIRAGRTHQGDSNVAQFMEPYLEQDRFAVLCEATEQTYTIARSQAPGLVERFRRIQVPELSWRDTLGVVNALVRELEAQHCTLQYMPDGIESILSLTRRFWRADAFPGKAVRLARQCEAAALRDYHAHPEHIEVTVDAGFVADVFEQQTGLPHTILKPGSGRTPGEVESAIGARIFDQPDAIDRVTGLVITIEQGLTDPSKPLGSMLFIGPSGVGKTETAKALAEQLFGSEERMIRFDMSEFNTPMAASRLIGTTRQPDGELTSKVRLQPFCVILLDEIEKAHASVLDLMLQVLGDGRLTDAAGRTVDFRNAIIIMTSNLGASSEDHWVGFQDQRQRDRQLHYIRAAQEFFRPEFFNRIDEIVAFRPLSLRGLRRIARRTMHGLLARRGLRQAQVMVDVDSRLIDHLIEGSVDPRYGARPLARKIERMLITPLAHALTEHTQTDDLTRVSIRSLDAHGVDLDLTRIHHAPALPQEALANAWWGDEEDVTSSPGRVLEAQNILRDLSTIATRVERIAQDPDVVRLQAEYIEILELLNDPKTQGDVTGEVAERLRQREVFLGQLRSVQERLEVVLDPRGTGEHVMPLAQEVHRARRHSWSRMLEELRHEMTWLHVQLESLRRRAADAATLMVTGIAGPYHPMLAFWWRLLGSLSRSLELELSAHVCLEDVWRPIPWTRQPPEGLTAFAVSTESPGILAMFSTFEGYIWSPKPPSKGDHALIVMHAIGATYDDMVADDHDVEEGRALAVEFIERRGQLEDLRLQHAWPIPEDRSDNLDVFAFHLAMARLALMRDVYQGRAHTHNDEEE